jgi:hypothetical protein
MLLTWVLLRAHHYHIIVERKAQRAALTHRQKYDLNHEVILLPEQAQAILDLLESNEPELEVLGTIEQTGYQHTRSQFLNLLADILVQPPREKGVATGDCESAPWTL